MTSRGERVFLHTSDLAERWASLKISNFTLGEIGFGCGLNFLSAWSQWLKLAAKDGRLDFVCIDKHPLSRREIGQALAAEPLLNDLSSQLLKQYPDYLYEGFHRLSFAEGRVNLTLIVADTPTGLNQLQSSAHPQFKNRANCIDTWLLKDTESADELRQNLDDCGFSNKKAATFEEGAYNCPYPPPWDIPKTRQVVQARTALIIGGGIAGCHTARALANRGYQVTLLETADTLASQGSGNPQGVLYGKLSPREETLAEYNLSALAYGQRAYRDFWLSQPEFGQQCGVLQLAHTAKEAKLHESLRTLYDRESIRPFVEFLSAAEASDIAGVEIPHSGIYFPKAGWVNPKALCGQLLQHPNIHVQLNTHIEQLECELDADSGQHLWHARGNQNYRAAYLVIASASHATQFPHCNHLPLKPVRGQVTYLPATENSRALKTAICAEGYIAPAGTSSHCIGATFDVKARFDPHLPQEPTKAGEHLQNLDKIEGPTPALARALNIQTHRENGDQLQGRAAFRCTTPDYLPIAGPAPKFEQFLEDYALLRKNAKSSIPRAGDYWPGLYVNLGHGSRGLTYAALSAELVASQIDANPLPVSRAMSQALSPARFIIRDLIRKKI
jgi:tRNA 5-methylaminomethyl-2-thiouridine biosynthesis bifunctional protein